MSDEFRRSLRQFHRDAAVLYEHLAALNARSASRSLARGWSHLAELHLDGAQRNRELAALEFQRVDLYTEADADDHPGSDPGPAGETRR
jgi:hypothetical protein